MTPEIQDDEQGRVSAWASGVSDQSGVFARNVTSLAAANVLSQVVTAVVSILVINHLGEQRYGAFKTAMAFATVFLIFGETGVGARFLYDRSGDKSRIREHFGAALLLRLGPYGLVFVITIIAAVLFRYPPLVVSIVAIVSVAAILRILGETADKVITVYQHLHLSALLRVVRFSAVAIGGILVVTLDRGPIAWAVVTLSAMAVYATATFAVSLRYARPRFVVTSLWPTLAASYIFGLGAIFYAVYENVDQVMLSKMMEPEMADITVGIYGAAYTLMMFTYTLPASFVASMEPVVFGARGDRPRLTRLGVFSSRALGVLALPLAAGTILLASEIKGVVFPSFDETAAAALAVLALFGLFRFFNFPGGMLMAAAGLQNRRVAVQGIAVVLNFVANLLLIPHYGLFGAAWATVGTELFIFACYELSLIRALPGYGEFVRFTKPVVATAAMALLVVALRAVLADNWTESRFLWLAAVPVAAAVYFALLAAMRFFNEDEKALLKRFAARVLRRRRPE